MPPMPEAAPTTTLIATRALPDRRRTLVNGRYTERLHGGEPNERTLGSVAEIAQVLDQQFGISVPPELREATDRLKLPDQ